MILSLIEILLMNDSFLDTNIIIYSLGKDIEKRKQSIELISCHPFISAQVLNETANTLIRKFSMPINDIKVIIKRLTIECKVKPLTEKIHFSALTIKERYQFSFYDSLIIASALESGCDILYSEDMQHKQVIDGQLQIINPF